MKVLSNKIIRDPNNKIDNPESGAGCLTEDTENL
jgi:hypothetical protein